MKLNLQKTTAAVLAVVFSAGAFAANKPHSGKSRPQRRENRTG